MRTDFDRNFDAEVGHRLREARVSAGYSQTKLAAVIGVSFQQVQKYERGVNRLPLSRYPALAKTISFNVTDLLMGAPVQTHHFHVSASERKVIQLFRDVPSGKRALVLELVKQFANRQPQSGHLAADDRKIA